MTAKSKDPLIDGLKGVAITLVVAAHLVKYGTLGVPDWYAAFKAMVYMFHMPLFMFLSGYVYFGSRYAERYFEGPVGFIRTRADRLLVPFFTFGLVLFVGKVVASGCGAFSSCLTNGLSNALSFVVGTEASPVFTIWYLFVLFVFSVIAPWIYRAVSGNWVGHIIVAILMYFMSVPDVVYMNRVFGFYVFFVLGGAAQRVDFISWLRRGGFLKHLLLGGATVLFCSLLFFVTDRFWGLLVIGGLSFAVIPYCYTLIFSGAKSAFVWVGQRSMAVYLLNVPLIGVGKIVLSQLVQLHGYVGNVQLLWLFMFGLFGSVAIREAILSIAPESLVAKYIR